MDYETGCDFIESKTAGTTGYDEPSKQWLHHSKRSHPGIGAFMPPGMEFTDGKMIFEYIMGYGHFF